MTDIDPSDEQYPALDRRYRHDKPLTRRRVIMELVGLLADGELTQAAMANRYGVTPSAITRFRDRHADAIAARLDENREAFDDLWIAKKAARLAAYQEMAERVEGVDDQVEELRAAIEANEYDDVDARLAAIKLYDSLLGRLIELERVRAVALSQVADELGAKPQRVKVEASGVTTRVHLVGVDMSALQ